MSLTLCDEIAGDFKSSCDEAIALSGKKFAEKALLFAAMKFGACAAISAIICKSDGFPDDCDLDDILEGCCDSLERLPGIFDQIARGN